MIKVPNMPIYLPIPKVRTQPSKGLLALCELLTASSWIWTQVDVAISSDKKTYHGDHV